ncbi:hypothetical protein Ae201684_006229 [Aphanomyces euteiches]|uniref:Uncharacterized protein n=1 Tax=Aphanomyces euteiches TaxID=100861 RepID=A0A6G0XCH9_9STRA|nr:hypothetical protein Ae201684_006229 [Aphanomyces euteiches]
MLKAVKDTGLPFADHQSIVVSGVHFNHRVGFVVVGSVASILGGGGGPSSSSGGLAHAMPSSFLVDLISEPSAPSLLKTLDAKNDVREREQDGVKSHTCGDLSFVVQVYGGRNGAAEMEQAAHAWYIDQNRLFRLADIAEMVERDHEVLHSWLPMLSQTLVLAPPPQ